MSKEVIVNQDGLRKMVSEEVVTFIHAYDKDDKLTDKEETNLALLISHLLDVQFNALTKAHEREREQLLKAIDEKDKQNAELIRLGSEVRMKLLTRVVLALISLCFTILGIVYGQALQGIDISAFLP